MNKKSIRLLITVVIFGLLIYYIASSALENIDNIKDVGIHINGIYILLALICLWAFDLFVLAAWRYLINLDGHNRRLSFFKAFGVYYFTSILKYLPGKVWSYVLQIRMMEKRGYQLPKIVFDNIILLVFTISTPACIGMEYYILDVFPMTQTIKIILSGLVLILYICALIAFPHCFVPLVKFVNRFLKRDIQYKGIRLSSVIFIQIVMAIAYGMYILAGAFISLGTGFSGEFTEAVRIGIICTVAMIIGFIALIMPGGLGIQESIIFSQVGNQFGMGISFVTAISFRLLVILENILSTILSIPFVYTDIRDILFIEGKISNSDMRGKQDEGSNDT